MSVNTPNVILIVLDTMRKDALYTQLHNTIALKKIANDGVVYENAIASSPWTVPSHASIFTGKYVSEHGVHRINGDKTDGEAVSRSLSMKKTLPEKLSSYGYATTSFSANLFTSTGTGFEFGFDNDKISSTTLNKKISDFDHLIREKMRGVEENTLKKILTKIATGKSRDLIHIIKANNELRSYLVRENYPINKGGNELVSNFIEAGTKSPFFAFLNLMEAHGPYTTRLPHNLTNFRALNGDFSKSFDDLFEIRTIPNSEINKMKASHFSSVNVVDKQIRTLIKSLQEKGIYSETMIIIVGDHGQAFKEHGFYRHGMFLFDELIRVPLIIKYPKNIKYKEESEGLIPIKNIYDMVTMCGEGYCTNIRSEPLCFSEQYELPSIVTDYDRLGLSKLRNYNVKRKAVFKGDMKLTIDVTNGRLESCTCKGVEVDITRHKKSVSELLEEFEIFVGNQDVKLPSIQ